MESRRPSLRGDAELVWEPVDPADPDGDLRAMLAGSFDQPGVYAFRLKLRGDAGRGAPHWHPDWEFGTVLSGAFHVATGERLSRADAKRMAPGAFIALPPRTVHAAWPEGETVVQIHGPGPRKTVMGRTVE